MVAPEQVHCILAQLLPPVPPKTCDCFWFFPQHTTQELWEPHLPTTSCWSSFTLAGTSQTGGILRVLNEDRGTHPYVSGFNLNLSNTLPQDSSISAWMCVEAKTLALTSCFSSFPLSRPKGSTFFPFMLGGFSLLCLLLLPKVAFAHLLSLISCISIASQTLRNSRSK